MIGLLSLPWSLAIAAIADNLPMKLSDRAIFVMLPAAFNLAVIVSIWLYSKRSRQKL